MANDIITYENTENAIANSGNISFEIPSGPVCTVKDLGTVEGKKRVINALNSAKSLSKYESDTFTVVDVITTDGLRTRTGEPCVNTYLILDNGDTLFSQSEGVYRAISAIIGVFTMNGVCDFGDGITLKTVTENLPSGNTLRTLVWV